MHSCLYEGQVRHRRIEPNDHSFSYPVVYAYLDLNELEDVFAGRWLWSTAHPAPVRFRREDYLGPPEISLDQAVREKVQRETGHAHDGPIRILTHMRHFGFSFNPVSFYYCFNHADNSVEAVIADITNTPWNERHAYVLARNQCHSHSEDLRFHFSKAFHVSPFMSMDLEYDWFIGTPDQQLVIHMKNLDQERTVFEATLNLERQPITGFTCARTLTKFPFMPLKVMSAIYWQALKLFWKRTPLFTHPSKLKHKTHGGAQSANTR